MALAGPFSPRLTTASLAATAAWCLALLAVFGASALRMQKRAQ